MAALLSPADLPRSAPGRNKARDSSAGVGGDEGGQVAQAGPASAPMVTAKEKEAGTTGAARQQHGSVGIHAGRGGVAPPAGVSGGATGEADDDHDRDHIQSPLAPTSPLCPTAAGVDGVVGPGAGAGDGSATTSSSLRPYSRGVVARSFSGNLQQHQNQHHQQHHQHQRQQRAQQEQWQREERAASLGDRYKGNSVFRHHHQQQHYGGSTTGNRYPSRRQGPAGGEGMRGVSVAGSSDGMTSSRPRKHSAAAGAGGDDGAAAASGNRRRSTGSTGRRDTNRDRDQDRGWEAKGEEGGGGAGGEGQQQGNGRVAQIAESLLWVQKHPVLAAVIWMCGKVLDPGSEATQQDEAGQGEATTTAATTADEDQQRRRDADAAAAGHGDDCAEDSSDPGMGGGLWGGSSGDFEKGRVVPPGFWKRHSKGRLSWSDDYQGGCLAEYYEDERSRMASNSSSVQPCDTDAADSTSIGAAASDGADRAHSGRSHVGAARARAAEAMRNGPEDGHADCSSSACRDRGSTGTASVGANEAAGDHTDEDGDEDGEVFHSALQLAESELEGVGGCAALVHQDTLYGDMQDAIHGRENAGQMQSSRKEADTATNGHLAPSQKPGGTTGAPAGGVTGADPDADTDEGLDLGLGGNGNGSGTPNTAPNMTAALSPGTWSPQWGWYVTMTPPQDQYPTEQNPVSVNVPGAKASTCSTSSTTTGAVDPSDTSASSSTTAASIKGRPPRP